MRKERKHDLVFAAYTNKKYSYDAEELYKVLSLIVCQVSPVIPPAFNSFLPFLSGKVSVPISTFILHAARGIRSYESAKVLVKAEQRADAREQKKCLERQYVKRYIDDIVTIFQ